MTRSFYPLSILLFGVALVLGCSESAGPVEPTPAGECPTVEDGVCDEPGLCPLGTDETDCVAECADADQLWRIGAACAHRDESLRASTNAYEGAVPSQPGAETPIVGYQDRTTPIPSGNDLSVPVQRWYRLQVPADYDPARAYPLVINMPGHRVGHRILPNYTQLPRAAELNDFIVVYAGQEFRDNRWAWWTDWDWANQTDQNPDFEFIRTIISEVAADYTVDRSRVFLSGHSRGAAMAFIGAIELDDVIAGAVVQSGFTEFGYLDDRLNSHEGRKVPLVFIHGVEDDDVCIDCRPGGSCAVAPNRTCGPGLHASDAIVERLRQIGWSDDDFRYYRLEGVAHRWQSQLNQQWFDFLAARPHPAPSEGGQ